MFSFGSPWESLACRGRIIAGKHDVCMLLGRGHNCILLERAGCLGRIGPGPSLFLSFSLRAYSGIQGTRRWARLYAPCWEGKGTGKTGQSKGAAGVLRQVTRVRKKIWLWDLKFGKCQVESGLSQGCVRVCVVIYTLSEREERRGGLRRVAVWVVLSKLGKLLVWVF